MDEMVKETAKFDFKALEKNLVEEKLKELEAENATEEVIRTTMKDFGIERSLQSFAWKQKMTSFSQNIKQVVFINKLTRLFANFQFKRS